MSEYNHEHDEDGNCIEPDGSQATVVYVQETPCWRFSAWDFIGIVLHTIGGVFSALSQGAAMMGRECIAIGAYSRQEKDWAEAKEAEDAERRQAAEELRALVEGPGPEESS